MLGFVPDNRPFLLPAVDPRTAPRPESAATAVEVWPHRGGSAAFTLEPDPRRVEIAVRAARPPPGCYESASVLNPPCTRSALLQHAVGVALPSASGCVGELNAGGVDIV